MPKVEKYGVEWQPVMHGGKIHVPWTEWQIERNMFMWGKEKATLGLKLPKKHLGEAEHFRRMVSIVLGRQGCRNYFEWNPNAVRIVDEYFKNRFLAIAGHGSCIPYETKLLDPTTGEEREIGWLCDNKIAPTVMTLDGPMKASVPFLKGEECLLEFKLANGGTFKCTPNHKLLTSSGYKLAKELVVGDSVKGYSYKNACKPCDPNSIDFSNSPNRSRSILDIFRSVHAEDEVCSQRTTGDSQESYSACFHQYGEQLPWGPDSVQSFPPSQGDAQGYKECVSWHSDALDTESQYSHPYSQLSRPSNLDVFQQERQSERESLYLCLEQTCLQVGALSQSSLQFSLNSSPPEKVEERDQRYADTLNSYSVPHCSDDLYSCIEVTDTVIHAITVSGKQKFYDLVVPKANHYFAEGCIHHNSGKTKTIAVIAVFEFIASPNNTAVLVTSTTINDSRKRVWGDIENYWNETCDFFDDEDNMPGKLLSASAVIRAKVIRGSKTTNDTTKGIMLIPGGESQVTDGIGRMKGFKAERMIFLGDELADLSHKLVEAAESNLVLNEVGTGKFKFVGTFNPTSHFGPDGILSEPKNGWGSLDVLNSDGWETKRGYCIRFDGERSPNVLLGEAKWKGLLTRELLEEQRQKLGDNSFQFMQQYRGAWSETGSADAIYTEAEIIKYLGMKKVEVWQDKPKLCAGFDPSHTHGGDRAVLVVAKAGVGLGYEKFLPLIEFQETIYLDDNLDTSQDKNELIISRLKKEMQERGIDARFLAMDATGGGNPLATLMARDAFFSNSFLKVQFGGAASDLMSQGKKGKDRYANMASELWYAGKPLLREGQIRGLRPEMVREMTLRLYEETGGSQPKIRIESKEDMKKRLNGRSPDVSDAGMLCIFAARARLGLAIQEKTAKAEKKPEGPLDHLFQWGLRKKPQFDKPEYVMKGGGWGDEGYDFDAMMNR